MAGPYYNETSDYYYPNMVRNSTTSDDVALTNGPLGFGWAVNLDSNKEKNDTLCLEMEIVEKNEKDKKCFWNPIECGEGAGDGGYPGVGLYFRGIFLNLLVSTGEELWNLTIPGPVKNNSWNEIGMRWAYDSGLEMFVNGEPVGHVIYSEEVSPAIDREGSMDFTVGCLKSSEGESMDYAYGEYDELTIWMRALDDNDTEYFLGGHACDVELHPLHCETNLEKILDIMDNMEVESTEALLNALDHLKALSEVEEDPPGSEDVLSEKKNGEELKNLITIIDKMINMTWNKPNDLTLEDLQGLMVIQDFASNLLDEKYIGSWSHIQNEDFRTSVDLMNRVNDYQMQKAKQTKSDEEEIELTRSATNIFSDLRQSRLYDLKDAPISFPSFDDHDDERRKKREVNEEEKKESPTLIVTNEVYGNLNKEKTVSFLMNSYKGLDRISPLRNTNTISELFTICTILSHQPPHHGAAGGLNFHCIL
nr:uncharacterized protein LOC122270823 [Parasteatoda tepidariorum]